MKFIICHVNAKQEDNEKKRCWNLNQFIGIIIENDARRVFI